MSLSFLAVTSKEPLMVALGRYQTPAQLVKAIPEAGWQRLSAGEGAKGPRLYDWTVYPLWRLQLTAEEQAQGHGLLIRRSIEKPDEWTFYVVFAPRTSTTLEQLARVAGSRWQIESCFEVAKKECGLDQYEVRKWNAWHRHVTLSLLAQAFLVVVRSKEAQREQAGQDEEKGAVRAIPLWM
jgi:SRSO17 transposase